MKVLIVEDDAMGALILEKAVSNGGYQVAVASRGPQAWQMVNESAYDALLVDLILPELDGISLIKLIRESIRPVPLLIVTTALTSPESRTRALEAGADDYLTKPYDPMVILNRLEMGLARRSQSAVGYLPKLPVARVGPVPFPVVMLAAGSGGPTALRQFFRQLPEDVRAAFFVVQQAPAQILETLVHLLKGETKRPIEIARHGQSVKAGHIYIAPADHHTVLAEGYRIILNEGPLENYLRPSANPLFRSGAQICGSSSVAVVLSGLGVDGGEGAAQVAAAGGLVMAQHPDEAVDPSMPSNVIRSGLVQRGTPLTEIVSTLTQRLRVLA
jgi:two-component system chemotaxis response regulator CheB